MRQAAGMFFVLFLAVLTAPAFVQAQEDVPPPVLQQITDPVEAPEKNLTPADLSSLLFTFWEHNAILDARRSRGLARPPTASEFKDPRDKGELSVKPPPEEREISLGGIAYISGEDWTIWLNGERVTPKALPGEVMDLSVHQEYIELKWYDEWSNQIFPIRLRPHQRFNIDTRIFLPG